MGTGLYSLCARRTVAPHRTHKAKPNPRQPSRQTHQRPTLRRIFQVFEGIDVLLTQQGEDTQRVVVNLKPIHYQILDLFGGDIKKCYIPDQ